MLSADPAGAREGLAVRRARHDGSGATIAAMPTHEEDPLPSTEPRLNDVLRDLVAREPVFHHPELGSTRADFERQTAADFWEVGASGRRYSREFVWSVLEARYAGADADEWLTRDFRCREVGPETYLLTYTLEEGDRVTRRLTVWQRTGTGWQTLYHQGTVVSD